MGEECAEPDECVAGEYQKFRWADYGPDAELEEQMRTATRELEKYAKENEKLKTVVMRYRERWDKLKEGARVRREGTAGAVQGTEDGGG